MLRLFYMEKVKDETHTQAGLWSHLDCEWEKLVQQTLDSWKKAAVGPVK